MCLVGGILLSLMFLETNSMQILKMHTSEDSSPISESRIINLFSDEKAELGDRCLRNVKFYSVPYNQTIKFTICNTEKYLNCIEEQFTMIAGKEIFYMNLLYGVTIREMIDYTGSSTIQCDIIQDAHEEIIDLFHLPQPIHNPDDNTLIFPHFQKPISALNQCAAGCGSGLRKKNYSPMIHILNHSCYEIETESKSETSFWNSFSSLSQLEKEFITPFLWILLLAFVCVYPVFHCVFQATQYFIQKQKGISRMKSRIYTPYEEQIMKNL